MELNEETVQKALECCTRGRKSKDDRPCLDCPYNECNLVGGTSERQTTGTCQGWLMKDALSLIKELTEEVEWRKNQYLSLVDSHNRTCDYLNTKEVEMVKLTEENERLRAETLENIKIQFAMRYGTYTDKDMTPITEVFWILDKIAKEMLEGE